MKSDMYQQFGRLASLFSARHWAIAYDHSRGADQIEHELVLPAGPFEISVHQALRRYGPREIERHPSKDFEVLGAVLRPVPRTVLVHDYIEHPMQEVLDGPVGRCDAKEPFRTEACAEQIVPFMWVVVRPSWRSCLSGHRVPAARSFGRCPSSSRPGSQRGSRWRSYRF